MDKLTVRVTLNLSDHLLQTPDGLFATLLWHLVLEIVGGTLLGLVTLLPGAVCHALGIVLVLIWNILLGNTLEVVETRAGTVLSVNIITLVGGVLALVGGGLDVVPAERLLLVVSLLQALPGEVWGVVPGVVLGRLINLVKSLLVWVDLVSGLRSGITSDVTSEELGIVDCRGLADFLHLKDKAVHTELSELAVADEQRSECAETVKGLVTVLLGSVLINWSIWRGGVATTDLLSLPDEVLKKVPLVLGEHQDLGFLDDAAQVSNELLAFCGKLLGRT